MYFLIDPVLLIASYIIGSIPFGLIVVKLMTGKDVRTVASGRTGGTNAMRAAGLWAGILTAILDILKSAATVWLAQAITANVWMHAVAPIAAILGHNYSIWLKFKGGRGLAPGAGIIAIVNFWLVIIWCMIFLIFYLIKRNVHIGNISATILLPLVIIIPSEFIVKFDYDFYFKNISDFQDSFSALFTFISSVSILILIKHINPLMNLIKHYRKDEPESAVKEN